MCGLRSEATQKHLLSKSDLTVKRALEIAHSQEAAAWNTQQLKEGEQHAAAQGDASTFSEECPVSKGRRGATAVEEGSICLGSAISRTKNAITVVTKDILPECAA